jgi:hypothetical protein
MNDIGYLDLQFTGSEAYNTIKTADIDGLKNLLRYSEMAVDFHTKEQNLKQVIFFQSGVDLINKRLKQKGVQ